MSANLRFYAFVAYLVHCISQVSSQLTLSSGPLYIGEPITLTCSYGSGVQLQSVALDAFNGTHKDGFLWCSAVAVNTTSVGVLSGSSFTRCPTFPAGSTSVSVTLTAAPSLELDYNCTARVSDGNSIFSVTSSPVSPKFFVLPSPPIIAPNATDFNQSDNAVITCQSLNGVPPANIVLTVSMPNGTTDTNRSVVSSLLSLPSPSMDWHNATATCSVTNHNFPNMTVTKRLMVKHVRSTGVPNVTYMSSSSVILNCATYVRSYPGVVYSWKASIGANVTVSSNASSASFEVLPWQWGSFICTATNTITMDNVTIQFIVSNVTSTTNSPERSTNNQSDSLLWVIGLVLGIIAVVVIAVVLGVLCKRGHFSKGKKKPGVEPSGTDQRSDNGSIRGSRLYVYDGPASWTTSTEHHNDADAFHFVDRHAQASGDVASLKGRAPSTSEAPAQDRHYTEEIRKPIRLLIAAEGIVGQLSVRALHSTAIVEYSDRSCSLNGILDKVEQAVARSPTKFRSVALLLRPATVGVTLSEVDQAVLNSTSIKGENGEKLRTFIARLAKICLDERGGTRMDILNYKNGKAPIRLSEALTELLGIPTTVSRDQFGVETPIDEKGGHAVVADTYFDRNNLGEVLYAELQLPSVKPQTQPRPAEEGVTYSEIRR